VRLHRTMGGKPRPITKEWVPQVPRIWGPGTARTQCASFNPAKNGVPHPSPIFPAMGGRPREDRPSVSDDLSRTGTCFCFSWPRPITKEWVPPVPRIWGPGTARTQCASFNPAKNGVPHPSPIFPAMGGRPREDRPSVSDDLSRTGTCFCFSVLGPTERNLCPTLNVRRGGRLGWDSTNAGLFFFHPRTQEGAPSWLPS
jgi:hypothetical protein